ncbi:unnamed protein product, partial [Mesorhabditis belari]|uniref:Histone acetyltransferase n=1 Tax=Mesorhabditis belari TaxID=2138241 RepID=A0AAF3F400_9BILA
MRRPTTRSRSHDTDSMDGDPEIGESYVVTRITNGVPEKTIAIVVATKQVTDDQLRLIRAEKEKLQTNTPIEVSESAKEEPNPTAMHTLYYIHYEGMDRRLDEWAERNRFLGFASSEKPSPSMGIQKVTRSQRRIDEEFNHLPVGYEVMGATVAKLEREYEERTKVRNIEMVTLGRWEIDTWYFAPYPAPFDQTVHLFVCEYCLMYFNDIKLYSRHVKLACRRRTPPGNEIYRKGNLSVFEVSGYQDRQYAQFLCLLSKLFMDHKTLYYDVETFLFYVLCEVDNEGAHIVGNFSKELDTGNNLACIMILPPYQRKGYGKLLIQLSYELSSREGWIGTPEKPLSDLGKVSYRSYWWWVILGTLENMETDTVRASILSEETGIASADIVSTLYPMQMIKSWKGDHIVRASKRVVEHCRSLGLVRPPSLLLDEKCLRWEPRRPRGPPRTRPKHK